ncbi:MAG: DMT family transporter [Rhodobacteraceae bacterium]|jgi:drug/metabolite transporter (DMT)-like permease|nr:DMT family transporter [Paracoccaceae bacterium]
MTMATVPPASAPGLSRQAARELALLATVWGGSFLAVRIALDEVPVAWIVAHRVTFAAAVLWMVALALRLPVPRTAAIWSRLAVMGLLNNVVPLSLIAWGQQHIETGLAAILNATTALMGVLVAAALVPGERLTARRLVGVLAGLAGVALAVGPEALAEFDLRSAGQAAVLAATVSYGCALVWARRMLAGVHPAMSATGMLTCSAMVAVPAAMVLDGPPVLPGAGAMAALAYMAILATAVAYLLYFRIVRAAGAGNAGLVTLIVPPIAILLGTVARDEALAPNALVGFAVIGAGLLILNPPRIGRPRGAG